MNAVRPIRFARQSGALSEEQRPTRVERSDPRRRFLRWRLRLWRRRRTQYALKG
jgi:hypothetical protein